MGGSGDGETRLGVIAGHFVPGALRVEVPALAKHLGLQPPRGLNEKRVTDIDETEVTLALDAVRALLHENHVEPEELAGFFLVSQDADATASIVVDALLHGELDVQTFPSSRESAGAALTAALRTAESAQAPVLYVAAQDTTWTTRAGTKAKRLEQGAGACAVLVGPGASGMYGTHAVQHHPNDPMRLGELLEGLQPDQDADTQAHVAIAVVSASEKKQFTRALDGRRLTEYPMDRLGDLGPLAPAAALLEALGSLEPGDRLDLVVPGSARTLGMRFSIEEVPRVVPPSKALESGGGLLGADVAARVQSAWFENRKAEPRGAYVPLPVFHAQDPARLRLQGLQCEDCDRLLFPPRERCPGCAGDRLRSYHFTGEGVVHSLTRISRGGAPAEFVPLQDARGAYGVAIVALQEGPRVAAMLTGPRMDGEGVKIDDPVRLVVRLLYVQDETARYSFKALPVDDER